MGQTIRASKPKPMARWTPRRLAELKAELDKLKQQVRIAEAAKPKTPPARLAR